MSQGISSHVVDNVSTEYSPAFTIKFMGSVQIGICRAYPYTDKLIHNIVEYIMLSKSAFSFQYHPNLF